MIVLRKGSLLQIKTDSICNFHMIFVCVLYLKVCFFEYFGLINFHKA